MKFPKPTKEQRVRETMERRLKKQKEHAKVIKERLKNRTSKKIAKAKEPRLSDLKKVVQRKVNAYVRERDKDLPCISCGKYFDNKDAGHYVAQGSSGALRYNLDNLAGQCRGCNSFKHGNLIEMRLGLIQRIGEERVKLLEEQRHDIKKWTREELDLIVMALK